MTVILDFKPNCPTIVQSTALKVLDEQPGFQQLPHLKQFPSQFKQPLFEPHCPLTILMLPLLMPLTLMRPAQTEGWGSSRKACAAVWGSVLCLPHHCTHKKLKHHITDQNKSTKPKKQKNKNHHLKKQTEAGGSSQSDKREVGQGACLRCEGGACQRGRGREGAV